MFWLPIELIERLQYGNLVKSIVETNQIIWLIYLI